MRRYKMTRRRTSGVKLDVKKTIEKKYAF